MGSSGKVLGKAEEPAEKWRETITPGPERRSDTPAATYSRERRRSLLLAAKEQDWQIPGSWTSALRRAPSQQFGGRFFKPW